MADTSYDKACRYLAKANEEPMTRWLVGLDEARVGFGSLIEGALVLPKHPERICDLVARLTDTTRGGLPVAALIEFQIAPDPEMFGRMLIAGGMVWQTMKPAPHPGDRYELAAVVVNLTGQGDCARHTVLGSAEWKLTPREINVETLDADALLDDIVVGEVPKEVLALIPLMKKGGEDATITRWLEIAAAESDLKKRGNYALAVVFAGAVKLKAVWKKRLEGLTVIESPVVEEWKAEAKAAGELGASIRLLLSILRAKFSAVPAEVEAKVRDTEDLAQIEGWAQVAALAQTFQQFRHDAGL